MPDRDLLPLIRETTTHDDVEQTRLAVAAIQIACPDITASDALAYGVALQTRTG